MDLGLGPGQRFASKGVNVVERGDAGVLAHRGWVVPDLRAQGNAGFQADTSG